MKYVTLKDVCTINMGQSPDSDSYNDNGEGVPFFQGKGPDGAPVILMFREGFRRHGRRVRSCLRLSFR